MSRHPFISIAVVALAVGASPAAARTVPAGAGAVATPPILRVPPPAEWRAIRRAEAQEAARLAYTLPADARYSSTEMNVFATEGSSLLELPPWHW